MENNEVIIYDRLSKDLKKAASSLSLNEAKYLVTTYYQIQDFRIATANQLRSLGEDPHETLQHFNVQFKNIEDDIKKSLDVFTNTYPCGVWCKSIKGIGPVLTAGLLAYIDITKAPTAGHIQAYAGYDPTREWGKGQKCPHNRDLKKLCWKIGESFVKQANRDGDVYGHIYKFRKEYENEKNEKLAYADQAKKKLEVCNIGKNTDAYASYSIGKLPKGHIQERCKRYAVKIFLSHLHRVMHIEHYGVEPPKPYAIAILGHAHEIECPNLDVLATALDVLPRRI